MKIKRGFTIVELMVVVGMIAIIIMLVAMNYQKTRAGARDRIRVAHMQEIRLALQEYKAQCGEYPSKLAVDESASGCPVDFTLGDVLTIIPENPQYDGDVPYYTNVQDNGDTYNGYFYSGLSTRFNGPCYEYHLGVVLESALSDDAYEGRFLQDDHDCQAVDVMSETYDNTCLGSLADFDKANIDTQYQMYDFRSAHNC